MGNLFPESVDLVDFHTKFGLEVHERPIKPSNQTIALRQSLIEEEMVETVKGLINLSLARNEEQEISALADVADGIVDAIYVLIGTAVSCGIELGSVWAAVHAANMKKVGGGTRPDGKILKPEGWVAPNIIAEIAKQRT